ncbi:disulfide bond formation protein B [Pseudomonas sp. NPDC096917]|uniref:disulfide bond formation protein B n=1 Tax=Pseudomonas sp. NPDC096917 TaxID=3364483 RepID=UPI00383BA850
MFLACSRVMFLVAFLASALVLCASLYLEYGAGLTPCLLCLIQRYLLQAFCLVNLIAYIHAPRHFGSRVYSFLAMLLAIAGAASATKQVLSQRLAPEQLMICQPDLAHLWNNLPLSQIFMSVYRGTQACVQIQWTLFDLSIPELSLLAFSGLVVLTLFQVLRSLFFRKRPLPATGRSRLH